MDQPTVTLFIGILTAAVTVGGWVVLNYFTVRREALARTAANQKDLEARIAADVRADHVKRLEILLKQTDSQISDFYGPLNALVHQIWVTWEIKQRIRNKVSAEIYRSIDHYFGKVYFADLHRRIREILREKLHLIEAGDLIREGEMPKSFYAYLKHSLMENIQIELWDVAQIDTSNVPGFKWDFSFPEDVKHGLLIAMQRRKDILGELQLKQSE